MNVLIVYAHPNPASFNHALLDTAREALSLAGHEVQVKDLYADGFDPILTGNDLAGVEQGLLASDVLAEQAALQWAEGVVFIYPLWWFDRPAILKGWFDRVFTRGFAFDYAQQPEPGLLSIKKAWVLMTTGGSEADFAALDAQCLIIDPMTRGTLAYCGIKDIEQTVFYAVPMASDEERQGMLARVRELAAGF